MILRFLSLLLITLLFSNCDSSSRNEDAHFSFSDTEWIALDEDDEHAYIDSTLAALDEIIRSSPNDVNAYIQRAHYLDYEISSDDALNDYDTAIEMDPENLDYRLDRAFFLGKMGFADKSIDAYLELIQRDPTNPNYYNNLAGQIMQIANWGQERAAKILQEKLNIQVRNKPNDEHPVPLRNEIYDAAITYFNTALKLDPKMSLSMGNIALCYYYQEKIDAACQAFKKAEKMGNESARDYINSICDQ